jgi:hypothetical protein
MSDARITSNLGKLDDSRITTTVMFCSYGRNSL